ncbi:MAG: CCA tRNA nucleotidyltransferase, partial [Acidimicrobiales bacterium]
MVPERLRPVLDVTLPLAQIFGAVGYRLYLVGGTVRDAIAGRPGGAGDDVPADIDLTTDALPDEVEELLLPSARAVWTSGKRFGTIGAFVGGRHVEITTHRHEAYDPTSRKPEVAFGDDIRADLS